MVALINEDFVMKALDFALEHNVHSMKLKAILESVQMARQLGDDTKAGMIVKRLNEIKKVSSNAITNFVLYSLTSKS